MIVDYKAEDSDIYMLKTDLMYNTDPELRAIAEVFVLEWKDSVLVFTGLCFCICWSVLYICIFRTMQLMSPRPKPSSWWILERRGTSWPLRTGVSRHTGL